VFGAGHCQVLVQVLGAGLANSSVWLIDEDSLLVFSSGIFLFSLSLAIVALVYTAVSPVSLNMPKTEACRGAICPIQEHVGGTRYNNFPNHELR
jgi:hypothetical protein